MLCLVIHTLRYCWLGLLTCKTVSQITYTVLTETLNAAHLLSHSRNLMMVTCQYLIYSHIVIVNACDSFTVTATLAFITLMKILQYVNVYLAILC